MENTPIVGENDDDESFDPHTLDNYFTIISESVSDIFIQTRNVPFLHSCQELLQVQGFENFKEVIHGKLNELFDFDGQRRDTQIEDLTDFNYNSLSQHQQEEAEVSSVDPFVLSQLTPPLSNSSYINTYFSGYTLSPEEDSINFSQQSESVNLPVIPPSQYPIIPSSQNLSLSEHQQSVNSSQQSEIYSYYSIPSSSPNFPIPSQNYTIFHQHIEPINFPPCHLDLPFIFQTPQSFDCMPIITTPTMSQDENGSSDMSGSEDNNRSHEEEDRVEVGEVLIDLDDNLKGKLVDDFVCICDCSPEVARETLIHHKWNMQSAIDAFLEQESEGENQDNSNDNMDDNNVSDSAKGKSSIEEKSTTVKSSNSDNLSSPKPSSSTPDFSVLSPSGTTTWAPEKFTICSWNVDGLDDKNLEKRTDAVIESIEKNNYSIVFLQELLPYTFDYIARRLNSKYLPVLGTEDPQTPYLVATFLRRNHIIYDDHYIVPFPNSSMGRNVLVTQAFTGRAKLALLNTHLESTADFASERKNQLRQCFEICRSFASEYNVIFGGDLNLRDKEVVGLKPHDMVDLWETCGQRESCRYTWDLTRNTNKQMPSKFQPRARFDRLYFRNSDLPTIEPEFFGVTGIEKVTGTQSFPSDHWAILSAFRLNQDARKPVPKKRKATEPSTF